MTYRDYSKLTALRKQRGMTSAELGKLVGRTPAIMASIEAGIIDVPPWVLEDFANALQCDVHDLFDFKKGTQP